MGSNKYDPEDQRGREHIPELPAAERMVPRQVKANPEEPRPEGEPTPIVISALEGYDENLSIVHDGEPFFTLRGQDFMAAPLVRLWADMLARVSGAPGPTREVRMAKAKRAYAIAEAMDKWPKKKIPD